MGWVSAAKSQHLLVGVGAIKVLPAVQRPCGAYGRLDKSAGGAGFGFLAIIRVVSSCAEALSLPVSSTRLWDISNPELSL